MILGGIQVSTKHPLSGTCNALSDRYWGLLSLIKSIRFKF